MSRRRRRLPVTITGEDFARLIEQPSSRSVTGKRNRAMLAAMWWQGLRVSELVGETPEALEHKRRQWRRRVSEWEVKGEAGQRRSPEPPIEPVPGPAGLSPRDVDLDAEQPFLAVRNGKGGRDRNLPIFAAAIPYLREWEAVRPESRFYFSTVSDGRKGARDGTRREVRAGEQLSTRQVHAMVKRYAEAAGVTRQTDENGEAPIGPHVLRASCATELLNLGWGIHEVQRFLGHESILTTQRYAGVRDGQLAAAVASADRGLDGSAPPRAAPPPAIEDLVRAEVERVLAARS